jgi:hypothetical protein
MPFIVDSHVHIFPGALKKAIPDFMRGPVDRVRRQARSWWRPFSGSLHRAQTILRHLPEFTRSGIDELSGLAPLPGLFLESTSQDLSEALQESGVDRACVIASPPWSSNEFILETCQENPAFIPIVNIPRGTLRPGIRLKQYVEKGARALKIHPAVDGEGVESPRYRTLLRTADQLGLPVILHTGCIHSHLAYKDPNQGHAERFVRWFKNFPELRIVLAHMNFHDPAVAFDLAEAYPQLYLETSWLI